MFIWRTHVSDAAELLALSRHALGPAECLQRDDTQGGIILCNEGRAPQGVYEKRGTRLFTAGQYGSEAGPWVFLVGIWTPEDWREEFCAWYRCEHGPMLIECPEWQGFEFIDIPESNGCRFYVLHRLADRSALDSEERKRSRSTPWFRRLAKNAWFDGPFERVLCRQMDF